MEALLARTSNSESSSPLWTVVKPVAVPSISEVPLSKFSSAFMVYLYVSFPCNSTNEDSASLPMENR
eukprot:511963-Amphidinium_carterae.4